MTDDRPVYGPFLHRQVVATADLVPSGKPWQPGLFDRLEGKLTFPRDAPWPAGRCVSVREVDARHLELTFVEWP